MVNDRYFIGMKAFSTVLVLCGLAVGVLGLIGAETAPLASFQSNFDCLKDAGYSFANIRAYTLEGVDLDLQVINNLIYAKKAGLKSELFVRFCRGKSAKQQVNVVQLVIPSQYFDRFWISLRPNPNPGCSWPTDHVANCAYVKEIAKEIEYFKGAVGVEVSASFYREIFGFSGCDLSKYPLIYRNDDLSPNFDDYKSFGGWEAPYGKVFQENVTLCDLELSKVYEKEISEPSLLSE